MFDRVSCVLCHTKEQKEEEEAAAEESQLGGPLVPRRLCDGRQKRRDRWRKGVYCSVVPSPLSIQAAQKQFEEQITQEDN